MLSYMRILLLAAFTLLVGVGLCYGAGTLVLDEQFDGANIDTNWVAGTNTGVNPGGSASYLDTANDQYIFAQQYDYIETLATFNDDVRVVIEVERPGGSTQQFDFLIEFVGSSDISGMARLGYGVDKTYVVDFGPAPSTTDPSGTGETSHDSIWKVANTATTPHWYGFGTFEYKSSQVKMSFDGEDAASVVETPWTSTDPLATTKVRIWGIGNSPGSLKYLKSVKIYAPSGSTVDEGAAKVVVIPLYNQ